MFYAAGRTWVASLIVAGLSALALAAAPATQPTTRPDTHTMARLTPNPDLSPAQVVKIQLEAMQHNDTPAPDAGLATTFAFASPKNQEMTGPLDKFIAMVKGPEYGAMLNYKSAEYADVHADGDAAQQLVKINAADGTAALYLFILSRQTDGQFKGCWMTDGVVRLRPEDIRAVPPPAPGNNGDDHDQA